MRAPLLFLTACTSTPPGEEPFVPDISVLPGVETATVVDAEPGAPYTLYDSLEQTPERRITVVADSFGQAHFAYLPAEHVVLETTEGFRLPVEGGETIEPGTYEIRNDETGERSGPFTVLSIADIPDASLYDSQTLTGIPTSLLGGTDADPQEGFQYIEMRDGALLSAMVRFPDPLVYGEGPYPTVVIYSGYSPSRPDKLDTGAQIANALGYAAIGVNMRGSGCSGGVFDVFNPAQHADGYDIIETVARQDWVMNGHVGMLGLSYPGISQLYVASTNPPSLAGIVPLSTIADAWQMQWPGGVYNTGFTRSWVDRRDEEAARGGANWVQYQIEQGDTTCAANTQLSSQNLDFEGFFRALEFRPPDADARDLNQLVGQIETAVFHGGSWQDEQTGPLFANLLDRYENARLARVLLANGRHPDGYAPDAVMHFFEFLEFTVAERVPKLNPLIRTLGADAFAGTFGIEGYAFPEDRFATYAPEEYAAAFAAYQGEDPVTVLFEVGAGSDPGLPTAAFQTTYTQWPPPALPSTTWYATADGGLVETAPPEAAAHQWAFDPEAGTTTFLERYDLLTPLWETDWTYFAPGDVAAYLTKPFETATVVTGPGQARLWLRSDAEDVTVQVTLTEIRPDGTEFYVQGSWLRLGHRAFTETADLRVERSFDVADYAPLTPGTWTEVVIPIPSFAHPVRAGSALQLAISAPGRDHGTWEFEALPSDTLPRVDVGIGADHASALVLGMDPDIDIPDAIPPCPSLRGQPCRDWVPAVNTPVTP